MIYYKITKPIVLSSACKTDLSGNFTGILIRDILSIFLYIICLNHVLLTTEDIIFILHINWTELKGWSYPYYLRFLSLSINLDLKNENHFSLNYTEHCLDFPNTLVDVIIKSYLLVLIFETKLDNLSHSGLSGNFLHNYIHNDSADVSFDLQVLNSKADMELRTTSFIQSMVFACSDSISHNRAQALSMPVLLLDWSQDWTCFQDLLCNL